MPKRSNNGEESSSFAGSNLPEADVLAAIADLDRGTRENQSIRARQRKGAHHKRTQALRSADMARISSMILQGASVEQIAEELELDKKTVLQDMQELNRLWVKQIAENSENFRALQLSKLMKLEALALESFHASKEKTVTDHTITDNGASRSVKTFVSAGDAAFLNVAKDCIKQQVSLLGLDGKEQAVKQFDKEAFLDAVAEKIAEVKMAATAIPAMAKELKEVEQVSKEMEVPF